MSSELKEIQKCFDILELAYSQQIKATDIKKQWKKLCLRYHPDRQNKEGGLSKEEAEAKFREVTHAYRMLTDAEYRYKKTVDDTPHVDIDIIISYRVSFEEGFFGRLLKLNVAPRHFDDEGNDITDTVTVKTESLAVKIPPGSHGEHVETFPGKGNHFKGKRGSAVVRIEIIPSLRYRIEGMNVLSSITAPLHTMLKGGYIEVATIYGIKRVRIKPGTVPGDKVTIKNHGVLKRGAMIVDLGLPQIPDKKDLTTNKDWDFLDINWEEFEKDDDVVQEDGETLVLDALARKILDNMNNSVFGG